MTARLLRCLVVFFLFISHGFTTAPSLNDKIAQMIMIGFNERDLSAESDIIRYIEDYHIGGVIFSPDDMLAISKDKTPFTPQDIRLMTTKLQQASKTSILPLLIATDQEGGRVDRFRTVEDLEPTLPAALYPNISDKKMTHELSKISKNLKTMGFNLDFAPVLDVNVNASNPIIGRLERSYSAQPELVVKYASAFSTALNQQKIQCTYKHFPGQGSAEADTHLGFVDTTHVWQAFELYPYQVLLPKPEACRFIMSAHIVNKQLDPSGLPATLSYPILTKLLRHHLHFQGVVISDDMQMKAIQNNFSPEKAAVMAINAGVDILLYAEKKSFPFKDPGELITLIASHVKSGDISEKRIEEAYQRIVNTKKIMIN